MATPKVWFITGASRGFGREWTIAALERGDQVAATARDTSSLDDLVDKYGDALLPLQLDVTDRAADIAAVGQAHDHFGRLDVVIQRGKRVLHDRNHVTVPLQPFGHARPAGTIGKRSVDEDNGFRPSVGAHHG